jgi:hypothetical protein
VTADADAQRTIDDLWSDDFTYGVIEPALMRPGRGHHVGGSNRAGWRHEERKGESERFHRFVAEVIDGLRVGHLTCEAARQRVAERGYSGFILICDSKNRMADDFAERLRHGDNAWVDGFTEPSLPGKRVLHVRCWHDPSHGTSA